MIGWDIKTIRALRLLLLAMVFFQVHFAVAATSGSLGATSSGSSVVSVTIPQLYRVSSTADLPLGTYSGSGNMTGNYDVCVYSNSSGSYNLLITGDTSSSSGFVVEDATHAHQIPMQVRWNNSSGVAGNMAVSHGTPLSATGANTTSSDCSSAGKSANLQVTFLQADLQTAVAANYSSTLTVLIEP